MARNLEFVKGEIYHIFNRGVDKRVIFQDEEDFNRFLECIFLFNSMEPIGSIYENRFNKEKHLGHGVSKVKLVEFICYCLNPNHFHFVLRQITEKGIEKFMHRLMGYSKYFNNKYKRSGSLFQGPFKAVHVFSNEQLLHASVYVNLNDQVHKLGHGVSKSSWGEYSGASKGVICSGKNLVLEQFKNFIEYKKFVENSLEWIKENKEETKFLF
jgi:putative transposase